MAVPALQPRQPVLAPLGPPAQVGQLEEAQIGQAQRTDRQRLLLVGTGAVLGAAGLQQRAVEGAVQQVVAHLQFEGGTRSPAAPAARPDAGQLLRQADRRAVLHPHPPAKALQQRDGHRLGGDDGLDRLGQHLLQAGGRFRGEAFVQPLLGDLQADTAAHLANRPQRGLGGVQPTEDQRLHEVGTRHFALPLDEAGGAGGGIGDGTQDALHGGGYL